MEENFLIRNGALDIIEILITANKLSLRELIPLFEVLFN
jgi:hypothetical protein